jgi:ribosomal subunit interface protein
MKILIQSKTLAVTEAMRSFIERQTRRLFRKSQRVGQVTIYLETLSKRKKHDVQSACAKFQVHLPGRDIVVERRAVDLYQAIADASASAARRLRKFKEKRIGVHRHRRRDELPFFDEVAWSG